MFEKSIVLLLIFTFIVSAKEDVPYFATSIDDKIVLYNLNDGSKVKELKPHIGTIISVSFSKNAQYLSISGDKQGSSAIVYDVKSGFTRKYFPPHSSYTNSVSLSTDYKLVATSSNDSLIKISYLGKGKKSFLKLRSHAGEVYDGIFDSTNESIFLSCGADRTIKTWNITDLNHSEVINEFINTNEVIDIQLSFDGKYIAGRSRSNDLNIYRRDGGKTSLQAEHKDFIRAMVFSPIDSNIIVTASDDKTIKIWDISKGEAEATLRGHKNKILFVGFANDGKYIISHDVGGVLKIWDFKNHALLMSYKHINGYFSSIPNIFINVNAAVMEQKKYNVNPNIFSNLGSGFHLLGTSKDITNLSIFKYVDAIYLHNKLNNVLEKYNIDQDTNQEINISKYSGFWLYNKYEDDINIKYKSKKSAKEDLEFVQYIKKLPIGWNLIGRTTKITTPMKFFSTLKEVNIYKNKKLVKIDVNLNTPLKENSGFWVFK